MKSLISTLATFLFLAACGLVLTDPPPASASDCSGCQNVCVWAPDGPFPADDVNGNFQFDATCSWCVNSSNGQVQGVFLEFVPTATDNIDNDTVDLDPSSIGTSDCNFFLDTHVTGELDANCQNGTVKLKMTVWYNGTQTCPDEETYGVTAVSPCP